MTDEASDAGGEALRLECRPLEGGTTTESLLETRSEDGAAGTFHVRLAGGPDRLHELRIRTESGVDLSTLRVRSAPTPSASGRIAFAFGSCWKPGAVRHSGATFRDLSSLARAGIVDHLLLLGDQIYADDSGYISLPRDKRGPPPADLDERFLNAYRESWKHAALGQALKLLPTASIWDDHEIVNGWGSETWHHGTQLGRALFASASRAYDIFQGARNPPLLEPSSRAHAFRRGPAAFLTLDLRTHRRASRDELLGESQKAAIEQWLETEDADAPVVFVQASVPIVHLPPVKGWARLRHSDLVDQWSSDPNRRDRRWLLDRMRAHADGDRRKVVLLGGDVHVATLAVIEGAGTRVWQLTSSPLSNSLPWYVRPALALLSSRASVGGKGVRLEGHILRRWYGPNIGVVRGEVEQGQARLHFELYRPGKRTELVAL